MQRCNGRSAQQSKLTAQVFIPGIGILLQLVLQRLPDPLPHFGGCSLGESRYQQPVYAEARFLITDFADNPLYEYRRFTGTCRRRYEDIAAALGNGAPLVVTPQASFRLRFR
jgi:hypothetical protein